MVEVDITTSHPFTLATILTEKFFTETKGGYNLYSIFPQFTSPLSIHVNLWSIKIF